MYCGTCLRDNSLARELIRQGHDVLLVPMYTPTLTDDENVSSERIFFGGISVYLQQHYPLFRKLPAFLDKAVGLEVGAETGHFPVHFGRPDAARRDDRVHASGRAGLSGQGNSEAPRLAGHRAACRTSSICRILC